MVVSHHMLRSNIFPAPVISSARVTWLVVGDISFGLPRIILVPSVSPPPRINMRTGSWYVLISTVEKLGHMFQMLCSVAFLFSESNALLASTRITPSVLSCSNINFIEWIAASAPPCKPVAAWSGPTACSMSLCNTQLIHFSTICLVTSPMPIECTPGFLSSGIRIKILGN